MNRKADYPREVEELLANLRRGIYRYVLVRGVCVSLWVGCLAIWTLFLLDWGYFQLERADLPRLVRAVALVIACGIVVATLVEQILRRIRRRLTSQALAAVLERHFPSLESRLLTVVELADDPAAQRGLSRVMYERTALELRSLLTNLRWTSVLDWRPLRRSSVAAAGTLLVMCVTAVAVPETIRRCFDRDLLLQNSPWPRETRYRVQGKIPPQERLLDFQGGNLFHPRGADLALVVEMSSGCVIPERVELRTREEETGIRSRAFFTRQGENRFFYTLAGMNHDMTFQIRAGDAERNWYRVTLVDAPRIDQMEYSPRYPDYTRMNEPGGETTPQPVIDSSLQLPIGTELSLAAVTNKPLSAVRIASDRFEIEIGRTGTFVSLFDSDVTSGRGERVRIAETTMRLNENGRGFHLPIRLEAASSFAGKVEGMSQAIPIPGSETLRISLEDEHGIQSATPLKMTLQGLEDESPRITTMLSGIGSSITRKARIPIRGKITDDYGVESAGFEYQLDNTQEQKTRDLQTSPAGAKEFQLASSMEQAEEVFDVLPLELNEGQKLGVGLFATDGDTLTGPHRTSGERYQFQIVSDEALLSLLHGRELNLRQRFEQIISELKRLREEMVALGPKSAEKKEDWTEEKGVVSRSLLGLRKNHNESSSVEQGFVEILRETVNNRVETSQSLERLEQKLIKPLHLLNEADYNEVDQDLGELQTLLDEQSASPETVIRAKTPQTVARLDRMLGRMEAILREMRRLETYGELVEMFKSLKTDQEELKRQTERERKRQAIENLK